MKKTRIILALTVLIALLLVCYLYATDGKAFHCRFHGIDISHHNTLTMRDFRELRDKGITFVYIKASQGISYKDPMRRKYCIMARKRKMAVGFYHFFEDNMNAQMQYRNFSDAVRKLPMDLCPVIDYEGGGFHRNISQERRLEVLGELIQCMKDNGYTPVIYCNALLAFKLKLRYPELSFWVSDPAMCIGAISQEKRLYNGRELDFNESNSLPVFETKLIDRNHPFH